MGTKKGQVRKTARRAYVSKRGRGPRRQPEIRRGKGVASGVKMIFSGGKLFGATKGGKYYGSPLKIRRLK